ncbi:LysR substrate-binding domain-containing protein [Cereibacter sp. SYSU M97828]|nr:LysR substrate-binding domain-containing protein [Cereibacter flavus]
MLDLVQVRSFIAVATELHFGRAARRLNMSQPPLSRQIRLLEDYLGAQLFERSSQRVALTPAGRAFLPQAQALLTHAGAVESSARQGGEAVEGSVRLGFFGTAAFRLLPRIIAAAARQYPRIGFQLREMNAVGQMNAFAFGELDIGIVRPIEHPPGLEVQVLMRERMLLALPRGHRLARGPLRVADLTGQPFIGYSTDAPYLHQFQTSLFQALGIRPDEQHRLAHSPAILSLVGAGLGLALVTEQARHVATEGVEFRPLPLPQDRLALTHLVARPDMRPPVARIHALIAEVAREVEAETYSNSDPSMLSPVIRR